MILCFGMLNRTGESSLLVFLDECGDHARTQVDPDFPLLLLSFVLVEPSDYLESIIPAAGSLKLRFWPHEGVNLHSRDIRKQLGDFSAFHARADREELMAGLAEFIQTTPFDLIVSCFHKSAITSDQRVDPYREALTRGLDEVLQRARQLRKTKIHLVAEARGKREDSELVAGLEAHRQATAGCPDICWEIRAKRDNIIGLQVADLCAYPAARHALRPMSDNPAFKVVRPHLIGWSDNKKGGGA